MSITNEQVKEEAKKLGLTLSDAQVGAYVTIDVLPKKEEAAPPAGDEDDDTDADGSKDSKGVQERIKKLNDQKKAALAETAAAKAALKVFQDKEAADKIEKDKLAGNWEKLQKDAADATAKANAIAAAAKEKFKSTAVTSKLETELLGARCPRENLADAVKLFDASKIVFDWTNEETLEYNIEDFGAELEDFKKRKAFLFTGSGEERPSGYQGANYRPSGGKSASEKETARLKELFPALR